MYNMLFLSGPAGGAVTSWRRLSSHLKPESKSSRNAGKQEEAEAEKENIGTTMNKRLVKVKKNTRIILICAASRHNHVDAFRPRGVFPRPLHRGGSR